MKKKFNKCLKCNKKDFKEKFQCCQCSLFFHKACEPILEHNNTFCSKCLNTYLPFSKLENLEYVDLINFKERLENCPNFDIQSLLDSMKNNHDDNAFLSDSIKSAYYDSNEFLKNKFLEKSFSLLHLNIASIQLHFDEILTLLASTNKEFDILCFSETKLKENFSTLINIEIPGYSYFHTPTKTSHGGTLIYFKNELSAKFYQNFPNHLKVYSNLPLLKSKEMKSP